MGAINTEDINVVLIGGKEHGKSTVGNILLKKIVFPAHTYIGYASGQFDGNRIKVTDTPSWDNNTSENEIQNKCSQIMTKALENCQHVIHVYLIVIRFIQRDNLEYHNVIGQWRRILEPGVFQRSGMIAILFELDFDTVMNKAETRHLGFEDLCRSQENELRSLFHECQWRIVAVNRSEVDSIGRNEIDSIRSNEVAFNQRGNLISELRKLRNTYTNANPRRLQEPFRASSNIAESRENQNATFTYLYVTLACAACVIAIVVSRVL